MARGRPARHRSNSGCRRNTAGLPLLLVLGVGLLAVAAGERDAAGAQEMVVGGDCRYVRSQADCNQDSVADICQVPRFAFGAVETYEATSERFAYEVRAADLDLDGAVDVVVTHENSAPSVLWNDGEGFFSPPQRMGLLSVSVEAADLDEDGRPDIIVPGLDGLNVLWNQGGRTFATSEVLAGGPVQHPVVGDFDEDGKLDFVVESGGQITLFRNEGGRGFLAQLAVGPVSPMLELLAVDLDGDSHLDLVAVSGNRVVAWRGDGQGSFSPTVTPDSEVRSYIAATDVDKDGAVDIVFGGQDLRYLRNDGIGGLEDPQLLVATPTFNSIRVARVDGYDLIVASGRDSQVMVLSGRPGDFSRSAFLVPDGGAGDVAVADVDGDGRRDLLVLEANGPRLYVLRGLEGDNEFEAPRVIDPEVGFVRSATPFDFDGDALTDLAIASESSQHITIVRNTGDGRYSRGSSFAASPSRVAASDLNKDGRDDLIVADTRDREIRVHLNRDDGTFAPGPLVYDDLGQGADIVVTDLSGDHVADIAFAFSNRSVIHVAVAAGTAAFTAPIELDSSFPVGVLSAIDLDKDSLVDLVAGGQSSVAVYWNKGSLTFDRSSRIVVGDDPLAVAAADFDSDGLLDLVVEAAVIGSPPFTPFTIIRQEAGRVLARAGGFDPGVTPSSGGLVAADLDGDDHIDLGFMDTPSTLLMRGVGDGSFLGPYFLAPASTIAVANVDGDDRPDLILTASDSIGSPRFMLSIANRSVAPTAADCNHNEIPDDCDPDVDTDTVPDDCDVCAGEPDEVDSDADDTPDCLDNCPATANPTQANVDGDRLGDACDGCPDDAAKERPGTCGCRVADVDADQDGVLDCLDECPQDPLKQDPGLCGCGFAEDDADLDGSPDCVDACPTDPLKVAPGACGCGFSDEDRDEDGVPDCSAITPSTPVPTTTPTATRTRTPTRTPRDFLVNAPGDVVDDVPGDGFCRSALGTCTLRAACVSACNFDPLIEGIGVEN